MKTLVWGRKVFFKPRNRQAGHLLKGAGLLKQLGCARNDLQLLYACHHSVCLSVQLNYGIIEAPDREQRWRLNAPKRVPRKVRPASAGNDRTDILGEVGSGLECRSSTGACPEIADLRHQTSRLLFEPSGDLLKAHGEQSYIKAPFMLYIFLPRQQIKEKRSYPSLMQGMGNKPVCRTVAAASAAMRKYHDRLPLFDSQIPLQNNFRKTNPFNPDVLRRTHTNLPYKANHAPFSGAFHCATIRSSVSLLGIS